MIFTINGTKVAQQGSYDTLSNGDGETISYEGFSFHVEPLGIPGLQDNPHCVVVQPDGFRNVGTPHVTYNNLPGVYGVDFKCDHDFAC